MNILKTLRDGLHTRGYAGDSPDSGSTEARQALTDRYDRLGERQAVRSLAQLNQVELTAIETFERSNRSRSSVLNKLRYLRQPEPLPGYDALDPDAIIDVLQGADVMTLKSVREYERKLRDRQVVLTEVSRALHRNDASRRPGS